MDYGGQTEISGSVSDDGSVAGLAVNLTGALTDTLFTDSMGYFSTMVGASISGDVYAMVTDVWGVDSNTAQAFIQNQGPSNQDPTIASFSAYAWGPGKMVHLEGQVSDDQPVDGRQINFSGALSGSLTISAGGSFSGELLGNYMGTITATYVDPEGADDTTTTQLYNGDPNVFIESVNVDSGGGSVTITGYAFDDQDPDGGTVTFTGVVNGTSTVDSHGQFVATLVPDGPGTFTATYTDPWFASDSANGTISALGSGTVSLVSAPSGNAVDEGAGTFSITVKFTGDIPGGFDLNWHTEDISAHANGDYDGVANGSVHFAGFDQEEDVLVVTIHDDDVVELNEDFRVVLDGVTNTTSTVTLGNSTEVVTIVINDVATLSLVPAGIVASEGAGRVDTYVVSVSKRVDATITFDYGTVDGSAKDGEDYVGTSGNGSVLLVSDTGTTISVPITDDSKVELDEWFNVVLSNVNTQGRAVLIAPTATSTIVNDDSAKIVIDPISPVRTEGDGEKATFGIRLNNEVDVPVTVNVFTSDGSAVSSEGDYSGAGQQFVFSGAANQVQTFEVTVEDDNIVEALSENYTVNIGFIDAQGRDVTHSAPDDSAVGTIWDNDSATLSELSQLLTVKK